VAHRWLFDIQASYDFSTSFPNRRPDYSKDDKASVSTDASGDELLGPFLNGTIYGRLQ
jgi:hypothetical protein